MCEEVKEVFDGNQDNVSENAKEDQTTIINQEEGTSSLERNQSFTSIQENITEVLVPVKLKADSLQIQSKMFKEKYVVAELKDETVQISSVKFQGKYFVMLGESNWRPKTRAKNKLRLNMKRILNPSSVKEKITVIEGSSSQEDMGECRIQ